jgi:hypothetical protein
MLIAQIYSPANFLGNSRSEDHLDPRALYTVPKSSDPFDVGGVSEHCPRHVSILLPLGKEKVANVVAHLQKPLSMGGRELPNVRAVDDKSTAVGYYRL